MDEMGIIIFQSFMEKHLGGVIHLVDNCASSQTEPPTVLPTFRPNLSEHLTEKQLPDKPKQRKRPAIENRRMSDDDVDDFDDDVSVGDVSSTRDDVTSKLIERCKARLSLKQQRPRFEFSYEKCWAI